MRKLLQILIILLVAGTALPQDRRLQTDLQDISTIKALFIYNFTKYIEWPQTKTGSPFIIQVYGETPVKERLEVMLRGRKINERPIIIKSYNPQDTTTAQIIYYPAGKGKAINPAEIKSGRGTLHITEEHTPDRRYSCINLIKRDDKLGFQLSENTLRREGLKIAEQLVNLAATEE